MSGCCEPDAEDNSLDVIASTEQLHSTEQYDVHKQDTTLRPDVEFQQLHDQEDVEQGTSADSSAENRIFMAKLVALAAINISESFHVNVIWSMAPFMMQDLGVPEPQIGCEPTLSPRRVNDRMVVQRMGRMLISCVLWRAVDLEPCMGLSG